MTMFIGTDELYYNIDEFQLFYIVEDRAYTYRICRNYVFHSLFVATTVGNGRTNEEELRYYKKQSVFQ
jgi:hypothetical protein